MGRKRIVTTVTVDPDVFQAAKDEDIPFSSTFEQALIDRLDPEREIIYLEGLIKRREGEILELKEKIEIAKKTENKLRIQRIERSIVKYLPDFKKYGVLSDEVERRLCNKLRMSPDELVGVFQDAI